MIIFGTRGITSTLSKGEFNCPGCQQSAAFTHKKVRRFFTLYFIPVIPLDQLGNYVECNVCQATYDSEILTYDPAVESQRVEAFFFIACKQVMISMLLADGVIDDDEVKMLQTQFQQITGTFVPEEELREEIQVISSQGGNVLENLKNLSAQLNDTGKETVINAAYAIAMSDGNFDESEQQFLYQIGQTLEMSNAHIKGVLASAMNQSPLS